MADDLEQNSPVVPRPEPALGPFEYAPLNHHHRSVRLIRVLEAKSDEGNVQCEIRHASIHDSYICLSYVWGEQCHGHTVLLNGRPLQVRNNLHDFLERARQSDRLRKEWLWVDAMCIDQANVGERNHQVQQMGRIYSYAKEVISWFGEDEDSIAAYFVEQISPSGDSINPDLADLRRKFTYARYWHRAWIAQEVQLARKVTLLAKSVEIDYALLISKDEEILEAIQQQKNITSLWRAPPLIGNRKIKYRSLIFALSRLGYRRSHDIRDRVYSLLALCCDGSDVQVDYDTSVERLARHTLECCKRFFCLCSMRIVHDVLHLGHQLSHGTLEDGSPKPFAYMTVPYYQGSLPSQKCASKPCIFPGCDGTALSHTSGFVHQGSQNDDPSITIYPRCICTSVLDNLAIIRMVAVGESRYRCDKARFSGSVVPRTWYWDAPDRGRHHHLVLTLAEDTCRIDFRFSTLIEIARDLVEADPCDIVKFQRAKLGQPVLRLCSSPE